MSFGDDNFLFNICSENMFNEDNSILGLINGNSSISILFDLENEEKTNFFNEDDDHYFLNDNNNNSVNNNVKNNDNNNIINNSSNHNNINKNNNNNNNNNVKNQLELEDKTKETTNIVRNNNTQKEIPENDKLLNKKRENTDSNSEKCSRFSSDNTIRKIKHIILDSLLKFINEKIKTIYNNNIGYGVLQKKLLTLNQSQKVDATINFNKKFMKKKLYEIFSDKISTRYTSFPPDFNKNVINDLMNEEDMDKKIYFQKLFNLTFSDCLSHFRGTIIIEELVGLRLFSDYIKKHSDDEDYNKQLEYYLSNFEEKIDNKRARKSKKNKQQNNQDKDD
jgi:hypothetical protein